MVDACVRHDGGGGSPTTVTDDDPAATEADRRAVAAAAGTSHAAFLGPARTPDGVRAGPVLHRHRGTVRLRPWHRCQAVRLTRTALGDAVALRVGDATLSATGWGEFLVHEAQPEVGSQWTDTGEVHEKRDLKGRGEGDTRLVPIHPSLVAILREMIKEYGLKSSGLLFPGEKGGMLAGSVFRRVWAKAREEILSDHEFKSPAGKRVYDLRHTCLTAWLNGGVPRAEVAEWAGNSVTVLLAIGGRDDSLRRVESLRDLPLLAA